MGNVISELTHLADYVLIDTPPILPVADALTVARDADAMILTARMHSTTRDEIEEVCELIARAGVRVIGVVAKGTKSRRTNYYRRRYGYGYGYGYQ
jgi:Mrp family chromosome partitioning ATPase